MARLPLHVAFIVPAAFLAPREVATLQFRASNILETGCPSLSLRASTLGSEDRGGWTVDAPECCSPEEPHPAASSLQRDLSQCRFSPDCSPCQAFCRVPYLAMA
jgi:hypothetical protein